MHAWGSKKLATACMIGQADATSAGPADQARTSSKRRLYMAQLCYVLGRALVGGKEEGAFDPFVGCD
ncbi:hypothetical protein BRADI_1g09613v3 [Brachypodium distachyon]|uniref:Uncharacterized protein n=1 Tax=Brachypodium distachyon TaxID=15368 RepID=A0A2K2DIT6_BRADI|nr:hypothetical protein BRADI_1g09613v3 [Brachypodium distachyon]